MTVPDPRDLAARRAENRRRYAGQRCQLAEERCADGVVFIPATQPTWQLGCVFEHASGDAAPGRWTFEVVPVVCWWADLLEPCGFVDGVRDGIELRPVALEGEEASSACWSAGDGYYSATRIVVGQPPGSADELAVLRAAWVHEWAEAGGAGVRWVVDDGEQPRPFESSPPLERAGSWSAPTGEADRLDRLDLLRAEISQREAGPSSGGAGGRTRSGPAGGSLGALG